jgi:aldehyde:ferredoxin oxidoreductase
MAGGYMGKVLFVDLSKGEIRDESLDERLCREFIGGYGIGARIIYSKQRGGVDPLGPDNTLAFLTGPLTGTKILFGARFTVASKSPLTQTWGDSNCGGDFGPHLKFAGYDGVFFFGVSEKPVYLLVNDGNVELRDAAHLWGKDTNETEDILKSEVSDKIRIASIGPAGEKMSLLACIIHDKGRAAGRSGMGAVMGSKNLKAFAVIGARKVPASDPDGITKLTREYLPMIKGPVADSLKKFGFSGNTQANAHSGASPIKNWSGVGIRDFPNVHLISDESVAIHCERRYSCYRCPVSCGGIMKAGKEYGYMTGVHRPEYETLAAFGPMCLNDNLESIIKVNDICNRYGLDTMSTGSTIAFAMECYENDVIAKKDTGDIELAWGNHRAIVAMVEKMAKREGFGAILADGSRMAAKKIGHGAEKYAFHCHGQELPMWDPRFIPAYGCAYQWDPTPGRHTQSGHSGRDGQFDAKLKGLKHLTHVAGVCIVGNFFFPQDWLIKSLAAVTGWELSPEEVKGIYERISAIRQAFNLREGLIPEDFKLRGRPVGDPPLTEGPNANVMLDLDALARKYLEDMDWDPITGRPSLKKLLELDLDDVARDIWGS